ncbi:hypothetical protein [Facilibium subflavum]|uniref:hypothetical protein n=1 Tax=Facilibium subflavum TaxID=2219058 RepID=UPI000E65A94E|nr:hypothetical protein [Facilibium subflavum]
MTKYKGYVVLFIVFFAIKAIYAGAILDVLNPNIVMAKDQKRTYISLQNIGNEAGTFTVTVKNVTDAKNIITYSNKELRSLPVFIQPILLYKLRPKAKKRITLTRNPRVKITKPVHLQLTIKEYKKPDATETENKGAAGIQIHGAIINLINVVIK